MAVSDRSVSTAITSTYNQGFTLGHNTGLVQNTFNVTPSALGNADWEADRIRKWLDQLSPLNFANTQNDVYNRRQAGTGKELFQQESVQAWLMQEAGRLFVHGKPGAGKTVFSSLVFHHLQTAHEVDYTVGVAVVYFNYKEGNSQSLENVVSEITRQLAYQSGTVSPAIASAYRRFQRTGAKLSLEEHKELLKATVNSFNKVYLIVDAIDEYRDEEATTDFIDLIREFPSHAALLVTSRDIPAIVSEFSHWQKTSIVALESDVRKFTEAAIKRSRQLRDIVTRDPSLSEKICAGIWEKCGGMFLLARFHMEELKTCENRHDIEATIQKLPQEPFAAYEKSMDMLLDQKPSDRDRAFQVLMWVWASSRPLLVVELRHAVALRSGQALWNDEYMLSAERIASICAGLINIDSESNLIRLVHETLDSYFEKNHERLFPGAHRRITLTCLHYLVLDDFASGPCESAEDLQVRNDRYSLLEYAASSWGVHAKKSPESDVVNDVMIFLHQRSRLAATVQAQYNCVSASGFTRHWYDSYPRPVYPIWVASSFGLLESTKRLLYTLRPLIIEPLYMALCFAMVNHEEESAQFLFEELFQPGNILENLDLWWWSSWPACYSALHMAVDVGEHRIVRRLLIEGADPQGHQSSSRARMPHQYVESPLFMALSSDNYAISKLLVQAGAHLLQDHARSTIFHEIISREDEKSLIRLCRVMAALSGDHGVPPEAFSALEVKDEAGLTPLQIAILLGNTAMAAMMILLGSEVKAQALDIGNALHMASRCGLHEIVSALLSQSQLNFLQLASNTSHTESRLSCALVNDDYNSSNDNSDSDDDHNGNDVPEFVSLMNELLKHHKKRWIRKWNGNRIDINDTNSRGQTPLMLAASQGYKDIVEMLIANNADVDIRDDRHNTAFIFAILSCQEDIVKVLISAKADVNIFGHVDVQAADREGFTPLHSAATGGHVVILRRLLAAGARVKCQTDDPDIPLRDASKVQSEELATNNGHLEVVPLLLEKGADLDGLNNNGWTPLNLAADSGHFEVVKLLLEEGADPSVVNNDGWTPLNSAVIGGHLEVVKLLLEKGADMTIANNNGYTPLNVAASIGHVTTVKILLEAGANVHYSNELGRSSLHLSVYANHVHVIKCLIEYGASPYTVDCYGRTSLDWASEHEPLLEAIGYKDSDIRITPIPDQLRVLRKSVRRLIQEDMSLNEDRFMDILGRCLIYLQDPKEARQAFRQRLEPGQTANSMVHSALCNRCSPPKEIRGERYVCQTCPDFDLCSSCMKTYDADTWTMQCNKHQFLQVLDGVADGAHVNEIRLSGELRKQWLETLARKYQH